VSVKVRDWTESDLGPIARLYYETVRHVNAHDYRSAQIEAWAPEVFPESYWAERFIPYRVFVAQHAGRVAGFIEFDPGGHIDCLYVHHACQRAGVGRALMERIHHEAATADTARLHADVSITARPFFSSMGFAMLREQTRHYRGQDFAQFLMEKRLR
jgi:putative acetyltransferase